MQIHKDTLDFLKLLSANNNRDWFKSNKGQYEAAKQNVEYFIDDVIKRISKFDPSISHHTGKSAMFRIYRDVRFSKDKSPYKTHFGAHVTGALKKSEIHSRAGYYIHIAPSGTMLAGGAYMPLGPWLKGIRRKIAEHPDDFKKVVNKASFKKYFGTFEGEQLKTAPKGYPRDHPQIELLRYKSFLATHECADKDVLSKSFAGHAAQVFKALYPFDEFLNGAA